MRRHNLALAAGMMILTGAVAPMAAAAQVFCPPGLAKKEVPCVPPGQVGKSWKAGDLVIGDYVLVPRDLWEAWGLPEPDEDSAYIQIDNAVLQVLRDTLLVVEAVGILSELMN